MSLLHQLFNLRIIRVQPSILLVQVYLSIRADIHLAINHMTSHMQLTATSNIRSYSY